MWMKQNGRGEERQDFALNAATLDTLSRIAE
jgi:hypothetical protein